MRRNPIESFYKAFTDMDVETMVSHYHDDVWFADPAFGALANMPKTCGACSFPLKKENPLS